jgi:DNA polymerase alpha-associated DNA helicase A
MKNVDVIESLINRFIELGISLDKISTITSYKGQQELLRNRMVSCSIGTVDSFQGDENEVVIFDITRDNTEGRIGFMNRPNRLNVAASRARLKLIVVGNHYNLKKYVTDSVFKTFLNEVSRNVVVVPSG